MPKILDITTAWGQALLTADGAFERTEQLLLPLTLPEKTALENAAALEGVSPESFLRAVWLHWYHENWRRLARRATEVRE